MKQASENNNSQSALGNNVIALVAVAFVLFLVVLVFLYFNNSRYLVEFKQLIDATDQGSKKMLLFSEFAELARGRTRNTIQILESEDVFEQDELNQQLEGYAAKFAEVREQLDEMPFTADDRKLYDRVFVLVPEILPRQRRAVEILMYEDDREAARELIYEHVLPGQQKIIDIFSELINREQAYISGNAREINLSMVEINTHNNLLYGAIVLIFTFLAGFIIYRVSRIQNQLAQAYGSLEEKILERTEDLKMARDSAVTASKAKSEFLSSMSHELRTPLNAIIGFSQLLEMEEMEQHQVESVNEIHKAGKHLLALINEVLDLARIEAGRMSVDQEDLDLATVLMEVRSLSEPIAARHGVSLTFSDDVNYQLYADAKRLKQVFLNLLSNAIKYNKANGQVTVYTEKHGKHVRILVKDTGKGISDEQREALFEPFNRLGAEGSEIEGSGIGMMVTRQLVDLMQGRLGFDSVVGKGSVFWVELPYLENQSENVVDQSEPESKEETREDNEIYQVLYVEDNPANIKFMQRLLKRYPQYNLVADDDPAQAVELAVEIKADLILLDLNMPEVDGFEVLSRLQSHQQTAKMPVIAVTANAMPDSISAGMKAGFFDYVTKPVDIDYLLNSMQKAIGRAVS